ncbi:basic amino acid ABC transporter substrate-binding protein [Aneurinibacillus sp. Ricciae_BoGa-3]|uniref:basic amino acid ABC transporter substrate-binding protein n=1 Tax=Aneurinibacillus sp. Ricciae_BoGa-3 TaxID=3022697 RepID=UPI002340A33E|nr:basic amino acid ABC transporter substrate-binding protein [Aneurinibacillus sp. Ricciae_BoGa-3]WCK54179.1 basic amino acid ABC transporter substrate-binding protein [Aneurinibacillus sp. Ricciae_BoGa-3]
MNNNTQKKEFKWLPIIAILAIMALLTAACGTSKSPAPSGDQKSSAGQTNGAAAKKVIRVGTDAAYPPFEKQGPDGVPVGFDMDIIKAIGEANNWDVQAAHTGWDPLFEAIKTGTKDVGVSAITIKPDRQQLYDFSDPYFDAYQLIMVPENSKVTKADDLKGLRVGVQKGTTGQDLAEKVLGKGSANIKGYADTPSAVEDLYAKRVDAVIADNGVLNDYLKNSNTKGFKVVKDPSVQPEHYGIMVKKGNKQLLDQINKGLKTIKQNGKYDEIFKKYFGNAK